MPGLEVCPGTLQVKVYFQFLENWAFSSWPPPIILNTVHTHTPTHTRFSRAKRNKAQIYYDQVDQRQYFFITLPLTYRYLISGKNYFSTYCGFQLNYRIICNSNFKGPKTKREHCLLPAEKLCFQKIFPCYHIDRTLSSHFLFIDIWNLWSCRDMFLFNIENKQTLLI